MKNDDASFNSLYKIVNYWDLTNKKNILKKYAILKSERNALLSLAMF